jgi:hypothetical protein
MYADEPTVKHRELFSRRIGAVPNRAWQRRDCHIYFREYVVLPKSAAIGPVVGVLAAHRLS